MAVTNDEKLHSLLLVGGEELQKLLQTVHQVQEEGTIVNKNSYTATGKRYLQCGRLNHFSRVSNSAANDVKSKQANAVELEQESSAYQASLEDEWFENVYLGQLKKKNHRIQQLLFTSMAFPSAHTWIRRLTSR